MIKKMIGVTTIAMTMLTGSLTAASAAEDLSAEVDLTIQEDLASVQVLTEVCPGIVGQNAQLDQNAQKLISQYLTDYSDKSMTYQKLQADQQYQSVLQQARQEAKQITKDEHQAVCNDLIAQDI